MGRLDDARRKREREDEKELEFKAPKTSTGARSGGLGGGPSAGPSGDARQEHALELIERAEPLIEQVNSLYNQFFSGAEKRPPVERREQLDSVMKTLQAMGKPTAALSFRYQNLVQQYATYVERWDRLLRQNE
jgi:hypothetical protein